MAKEELLSLEGLIDEILPDGRFRVRLENGISIIAYTAGRMRRGRIRSVVGDQVRVEMTPYDLEKGRIVYQRARHRPIAGIPAQTTIASYIQHSATRSRQRTYELLEIHCRCSVGDHV